MLTKSEDYEIGIVSENIVLVGIAILNLIFIFFFLKYLRLEIIRNQKDNPEVGMFIKIFSFILCAKLEKPNQRNLNWLVNSVQVIENNADEIGFKRLMWEKQALPLPVDKNISF